jgi:hypothetical protein
LDPLASMVRKGSSVRVRLRAFTEPRYCGGFAFYTTIGVHARGTLVSQNQKSGVRVLPARWSWQEALLMYGVLVFPDLCGLTLGAWRA